jgi:hypothetical protein
MTEIILEKNLVAGQPGKWKVDLIAQNLPEHFLGLAADLQFEGDLGGASYEGMELAPALMALPAEQQPIKMVKALPGEGKLVMGMTFRANHLPKLADGLLASFVFKGDDLNLQKVLNPVVSTYQDGRKDWPAVSWTIKNGQIEKPGAIISENKSAVMSKHVMKSDEQVESMPVAEQQLDLTGAVETNFNQATLAEILNRPQPATGPGDFGWWWLIVLAAIPLILAGCGWGLWQAYRRGGLGGKAKSPLRASAKAEFA